MNDTNGLAHTKWNCKYHIVFAPKYRRKVFFGEKRREIGRILRQLCEWKKVAIVEAEVCPDHIHTTTTMEYQMEMLPFECTEGVMALYRMVHDICLEDGFGVFPLKHIGGSSDTAYAVIAGVPSLCSCGIQGEWNHTTREYAILESLYTRTKQWADVVNHIK